MSPDVGIQSSGALQISNRSADGSPDYFPSSAPLQSSINQTSPQVFATGADAPSQRCDRDTRSRNFTQPKP